MLHGVLLSLLSQFMWDEVLCKATSRTRVPCNNFPCHCTDYGTVNLSVGWRRLSTQSRRPKRSGGRPEPQFKQSNGEPGQSAEQQTGTENNAHANRYTLPCSCCRAGKRAGGRHRLPRAVNRGKYVCPNGRHWRGLGGDQLTRHGMDAAFVWKTVRLLLNYPGFSDLPRLL